MSEFEERNPEEYFIEQRDLARDKAMGFLGLDHLSNIELVELNQLVRRCIEENSKIVSPKSTTSDFNPGTEAAVRFCIKNYGYNPADVKERQALLKMRREELRATGRDTFEYFRRKQDRDHLL